MLTINKVHQGDCIELMKEIESGTVDMVLCDLPYGVTARNKWDTIIPFDKLWEQYERITKDNAAIVLFAQDKFTAHLVLSNEKIHRYNLIWDKEMTTGFLNANKMPLRCHEDIVVFYNKPPVYNPQKTVGNKSHSKGHSQREDVGGTNYNKASTVDNVEEHGNMKFPTSILRFQKVHPSKVRHPTEKPILLGEYLINTYTNPGDLVLDNCCGSGSFLAAAKNTGRNFIGIDTAEDYCVIARERVKLHEK